MIDPRFLASVAREALAVLPSGEERIVVSQRRPSPYRSVHVAGVEVSPDMVEYWGWLTRSTQGLDVDVFVDQKATVFEWAYRVPLKGGRDGTSGEPIMERVHLVCAWGATPPERFERPSSEVRSLSSTKAVRQ